MKRSDLKQLIYECIREIREEEDYPPYDPQSDTFMDVPDEMKWMHGGKDGQKKDTDTYIITAKSGPQTVFFVDSPTQGKRFIPSAHSMAVRFVSKKLADEKAEMLKNMYHGLRNSIKVERDTASTAAGNSGVEQQSGGKFMESSESTDLINGQSNQVAATRVNKILSDFSKGIFSDDSWQAVHKIFAKLKEVGLDVELLGAKYGGQSDSSGGLPTYKEWQISIPFTNNKGKSVQLIGQITAHGAGTVEDPLSRYDITAYVTPVAKRM